jgi:Protein similar to CwfJ C-terminus 1/Protein similar to CwfJ C-terminus 2
MYQLCPNLHYLGKRSTIKTLEGIRIVTLGGRLDDKIVGISKEQFLPFHTIDDAKALRGANTADILLTTLWPASIQTGSKVPLPEHTVTNDFSCEHISELCATLKPRYHFSSSNFFYEREPFFHPSSPNALESRNVTRFISLAVHSNPLKQKSLYAFSLQPSADPLAPLPPGTTVSPFTTRANSKKRSALDPEPYSRFSNDDNSHRRKRRRDNQPPPGPDECFFCLSNPNLATHLVASIGDESYVAIAKGPLTTSHTNAEFGINFPAHTLIIPLTHSPTLAFIPDEESRTKTYDEMKRYKKALQTMVASHSSSKLGTVTYEISRLNGVHTHWQLLPIPNTTIKKGLVEAAFRVEAENLSYPAFEVRDPGIGREDGNFFRVWIWTPPNDDDMSDEEGTTKCLILPLNENARFDLQFGRRVLAKLLGLEKRIQWRDCSQTEEQEKCDVEAFKKAFKEFDFSI